MLQQGSSGDEVLKLQNMLTTLGFYTGNKTGNFGALTADAVTAYQKSKGLTADGIAGKIVAPLTPEEELALSKSAASLRAVINGIQL